MTEPSLIDRARSTANELDAYAAELDAFAGRLHMIHRLMSEQLTRQASRIRYTARGIRDAAATAEKASQ